MAIEDVLHSVWLNALIAALIAATVVILITIIIERTGAIGGVIASTPTTIIFSTSSLVIELNRESNTMTHLEKQNFIASALLVVPVCMTINSLILLCFRLIPSRLPQHWGMKIKLPVVLAIVLTMWLVLSLALVFLTRYGLTVEHFPHNEGIIVMGCIFSCVVLVIGAVLTWKPLQPTSKRNKVPWYMLLVRGGLAFVCIFAAVAIGKVDPILGGLAAAFPAIFLTTMIALWVSQGEDVMARACGPMILGSVSVVLFCIVACFTVLNINLPAGIIISYVVAVVLASIPGYFYIRWRINTTWPSVPPPEQLEMKEKVQDPMADPVMQEIVERESP